MAFVDFMQRIRAHDCDTVDTHRFQPIQLGSEWVEKEALNVKRLYPQAMCFPLIVFM